jgi:hypothetical protein
MQSRALGDTGGKWTRVWRAARDEPQKAEIIRMVTDPEMRQRLVAAAVKSEAPVGVVAPILRAQMSPEFLDQHAVRTFIGLVVAAALWDEGFEPTRSVRLRNDPIFASGSLFRRRVHALQADSTDVLERMLAALTKAEKVAALRFLQSECDDE